MARLKQQSKIRSHANVPIPLLNDCNRKWKGCFLVTTPINLYTWIYESRIPSLHKFTTWKPAYLDIRLSGYRDFYSSFRRPTSNWLVNEIPNQASRNTIILCPIKKSKCDPQDDSRNFVNDKLKFQFEYMNR